MTTYYNVTKLEAHFMNVFEALAATDVKQITIFCKQQMQSMYGRVNAFALHQCRVI
jgi:hypothetical protein